MYEVRKINVAVAIGVVCVLLGVAAYSTQPQHAELYATATTGVSTLPRVGTSQQRQVQRPMASRMGGRVDAVRQDYSSAAPSAPEVSARGQSNVFEQNENGPAYLESDFAAEETTTTKSSYVVLALTAFAGVLGAAYKFVSTKSRSAYEALGHDSISGDIEQAPFARAGAAAVAVAASAALAGPAMANVAPVLTYDELQGLSYNEVKGTGLSNQCPIVDRQSTDTFSQVKAGAYNLENFCIEPSSFEVKEIDAKGREAWLKTKLMTRLTYTLDAMSGKVTVSDNGDITLKETDGIDYAAVTVQLSGGERVPFLFSIKNLDAKGNANTGFGGPTVIPSYRGSSFLDPKGRGASLGYGDAVALPAGGNQEELEKENVKKAESAAGNAYLKVTQVSADTGEIGGVIEAIQPSDTDLGAKEPKDIKIKGVWYGRLTKA